MLLATFFFRLKSYINYVWNAKDEHSIHSPFLYYLYNFILKPSSNTGYEFYCFNEIEHYRDFLKNDNTVISISDFGTGKDRKEKISSILNKSVKPQWQSHLIFRLINFYNPLYALEIGTSLGITTSYIAKVNSSSTIYTIEGSEEIYQLAKQTFKNLGIKNITPINGDFDSILPELLYKIENIKAVFIDGNHQYDATLRYFNLVIPKINKNNSVIIIDDIYWSKGMAMAWDTLKKHPIVNASIDFYYFGLIIINSDIRYPEHHVLKV